MTNILIPFSAYHFVCSYDEESGFFCIVGNSPDYIAFITEDNYPHNQSPNNLESITLNLCKKVHILQSKQNTRQSLGDILLTSQQSILQPSQRYTIRRSFFFFFAVHATKVPSERKDVQEVTEKRNLTSRFNCFFFGSFQISLSCLFYLYFFAILVD